jgi:hypothetical protein
LENVFDDSGVAARGGSGLQELGAGGGGFGIDEVKLLMLAFVAGARAFEVGGGRDSGDRGIPVEKSGCSDRGAPLGRKEQTAVTILCGGPTGTSSPVSTAIT